MTDPSGDNRGASQSGGGGARKTVMRSLGEFFGHIAHAVRTDPSKPAREAGVGGVEGADPGEAVTVDRKEVRRTVEEEQRDTPRGKVTLRRTIIEEVEVPREDVGREE